MLKIDLKTFLYRIRFLFRGYPKEFSGFSFLIDESLRRLNLGNEDDFIRHMIKFLPKDGVFIDVGANLGIHSIIAASHMGKGCKVIAVEPIKSNQKLLHKNIKLNKLSERITLIPSALSSKKGIQKMYFEDGFSPAASFKSEPFLNNAVKVPTETLDSIIFSHKLIPNLIKIDVEGAEYEVLKGGKKTLSITNNLLIEIHNYKLSEFETSLDEILSFLKEFGFKSKILAEYNNQTGLNYSHYFFTKNNLNSNKLI
tara:strand:+ start:501 stop:1265 length:765 start_codon:yes stop_codon:yes gene_type:complete